MSALSALYKCNVQPTAVETRDYSLGLEHTPTDGGLLRALDRSVEQRRGRSLPAISASQSCASQTVWLAKRLRGAFHRQTSPPNVRILMRSGTKSDGEKRPQMCVGGRSVEQRRLNVHPGHN